MTTAQDIMARASEHLRAASPVSPRGTASYRLVLTGAGGGTWHLSLAEAQVTHITGTAAPPADCTMTLAAEDFVALAEGRRRAEQLFFAGKLRVEGNLALAFNLQRLAAIMRGHD